MELQTQTQIQQKIEAIASIAEELPGVVVIHDPNLALLYMSKRGLDALGVTLEELQGLNAEAYHARYFNQEDAKEYTPKLLELLNGNSDETVSFFQQVRTGDNGAWQWHISSIKVLLRDDAGKPLLIITLAFPVERMTHLTTKVQRLLEENQFLRNNYSRYSQLSKREKDVLRLLASGKSSAQIAEALYISVATVETHRKNIKQKLGASSLFDLTSYARAFDLI